MFLTVNQKGDTKRIPKKKEGTKKYATGIVYLIKMELDNGDTIIKIGVTGRKSVQDRLMENISAFFMCHRYIPRTTLIKHSRTKDYFRAEKLLHRIYKKDKYVFEKQFQGYSEYFQISDVDKLKELYCTILADCQTIEGEKPPKPRKLPETPECPGM